MFKYYTPLDLDDDMDDIESFFVDPEFDVIDGDICIKPATVRWASDENAGYAT